MLAFALRRLAWAIPTLLIVATLVFFMMRSIGGSPLRHGPFLGLSNVAWVKYADAQPEEIERNQLRKFGLDRPWYEQYATYLESMATLDFGPSLTFENRTVNDIVRTQAPISMKLGGLAFLIAVVVGGIGGVAAGLRRGTAVDTVVRVLSAGALAVPVFLLATLMIWAFAVEVDLFPTSGWQDGWRSAVLPALALAALPAAYIARLLRASVIETLESDYVRYARARGLRRRRVVGVHVLRNAALPAITVAGPLLGFLVTGSFIVEAVFGIPGIGRYYVAAVSARDYPLVMALTLLLAVVIVLVNLVVDLLHAALDPRVRESL
jgi:oligopeptide transport system permease protein